MASTKLPVGTLVIFSFFLLVMAVTYTLTKPPPRPAELEGVLRPDFRPLLPFRLTDQHNRPFDEKRLQGKWTFVFFGYTSCPDICPTTLNVLSGVYASLPENTAADTQVVFVSVDPARDTPEKLAEYVSYFNRDFIGASGDKQQIDAFSRQFGAGYIIERENPDAPGTENGYTVSHTSAIFLLDPSGRLVAIFSQPHQVTTIVSLYNRIRAYFSAA